MKNDIEYNLKMTFKNDNPNDFSNGEIPVYYLNDKKLIMYEYIWEGGDSEPYIDIFLDTENSEYVHRITAEKLNQEGLDIDDKDYENFVVNYMNRNTEMTLNDKYYKLNVGENGIEVVKDKDLSISYYKNGKTINTDIDSENPFKIEFINRSLEEPELYIYLNNDMDKFITLRYSDMIEEGYNSDIMSVENFIINYLNRYSKITNQGVDDKIPLKDEEFIKEHILKIDYKDGDNKGKTLFYEISEKHYHKNNLFSYQKHESGQSLNITIGNDNRRSLFYLNFNEIFQMGFYPVDRNFEDTSNFVQQYLSENFDIYIDGEKQEISYTFDKQKLSIELFEETYHNTNYKMNDSVVSYHYKKETPNNMEEEIHLRFNKEQEEPDISIPIPMPFNSDEDVQEYVRDYIQRNAKIYLNDIPVKLSEDGKKLINVVDLGVHTDIRKINKVLSKRMEEINALQKEQEKLMRDKEKLIKGER